MVPTTCWPQLCTKLRDCGLPQVLITGDEGVVQVLITVAPLIKDHITFKTTMPEDTCLGLHYFLPLKKDHPSSKITICVNHRVVSQEGDYCREVWGLKVALVLYLYTLANPIIIRP